MLIRMLGCSGPNTRFPISNNNALAHLYVLNGSAAAIEVRNETSGALLATFNLGTGNSPQGIGVDSTRGRIYVDVINTNTSAWSMFVIEDLSGTRVCGSRGSC